ncbi:response regulator [Puteibacter caeruleilacunae]|nr:response regulator [Puteibacter caeruleilacunae]
MIYLKLKNYFLSSLLVTLLLFLSLPGICTQQIISENLNFMHLTVEDGLTQNTIYKIFQDREGKIWIGTEDGLNCYNGYEVENYYYNPEDPNSVSGTIIKCITEDIQGNLWFGSEDGVCRYIPDINGFKVYPEFVGKGCAGMVTDSQGSLWILVGNNLCYYDKEYDKFEVVSLKGKTTNIGALKSLIEIGQNRMVLSSSKGVYLMDLDTKNITPVEGQKPAWDGLRWKGVSRFFKDSQGRIWGCNGTQGLFVIVKKGDSFHMIQKYPELFRNVEVRSVNEDASGNIWVGTYKGLYLIGLDGGVNHITPDNFNPMGLSYRSIMDIYRDRDNNMWVGTYFGGVNIYRDRINVFRSIWPRQLNGRINNNAIRGIAQAPDGKIWVGTQSAGIVLFDPVTGTAEPLLHRAIRKMNIHALCFDRLGHLWIGTYRRGLFVYNPKTKKIKEVVPDTRMPEYSEITMGKNGDLWLASSYGLIQVPFVKNKYQEAKIVRTGGAFWRLFCCLEAKDGKLFMGNYQQLVEYDPKTDKEVDRFKGIDYKNKLKGTRLCCLFEDSERNLWIGTKKAGLFKLSTRKKIVENFTTNEGLVNNSICGIIEDEIGFIWISTNKGLMRFRKNFTDVEQFSVDDGLPSNQFTYSSSFIDANHQLYFGSINGLTYFNPTDIHPDTIELKPAISDVRVLNKSIKFKPLNGVRYYNGHEWNNIVLKEKQNSFSIDFTTFFYGKNASIKYGYRLINHHDEWIETSDRTVYFHNVEPGEYTFELKVASPDGHWNPEAKLLKIEVLPIWWITSEAISLYFLVLLIIALIAFKIMSDRIKAKNDIRIGRIEKEKEKEVTQMRLRFFTNISHEFRTPLTLISGPLEKLDALEEDPQKIHLLGIAKRNTNRMLNLVNDILDFRKAEQNVLNLRLGKSNMSAFLQQQVNAFNELANRKGIKLSVEIGTNVGEWIYDISKIGSVLYNLLSNAIKYSDFGDSVIVKCTLDEALTIQVEDTGKGIPAEDIAKIFDRFYRVAEAEEKQLVGSGIGLALAKEIIQLHGGTIKVESQEQKGTSFTINLPPISESEVEISNSVDVQGMPQMTAADWDLSKEFGPTDAKRILLVDDNHDLLAFVTDLLCDEYRVRTAENGKDAIGLIQQFDPDIIISDVMMPVMNGIEFCRRVKGNIETSHILFILLTAKETIEDQIQGFESGADIYIPKPFNVRLFRAQIENLLKLRTQQHNDIDSGVCLEASKLNISSLDQKLFADAKALIEQNLDNAKFSTTQLSEELGVSTSTLYRKLVAITGKSGNEFIRAERLRHAKRMLDEGELSVTEIAYKSGFNSLSYFGTCFKKEFGQSPNDYLKK